MRICVLFTKTSLQNCILLAVATHVETIVLLINQNAKAKHHVEIGVDAEDYYRIKDSEEAEEKYD